MLSLKGLTVGGCQKLDSLSREEGELPFWPITRWVLAPEGMVFPNAGDLLISFFGAAMDIFPPSGPPLVRSVVLLLPMPAYFNVAGAVH